jgi:hypothetical protein
LKEVFKIKKEVRMKNLFKVLSLLLLLVSCAGDYGEGSYVLDEEILTDLKSGLMWQRNTPEVFEGCTKGNNGSLCSWEEAVAYCKNLVLDGYSDWKIPTVNELATLVENDTNPTRIEGLFSQTPPKEFFWAANAHKTFFFPGGLYSDNWNNRDNLVRCVRRDYNI